MEATASLNTNVVSVNDTFGFAFFQDLNAVGVTGPFMQAVNDHFAGKNFARDPARRAYR